MITCNSEATTANKRKMLVFFYVIASDIVSMRTVNEKSWYNFSSYIKIFGN